MTGGTLLGLRILIVEDEPLIAKSVEAALRERGADVMVASTDRAAYHVLECSAGTIDVLVADINLREGTTGFDVARFARRLAPAVAVIYLSGGSEDSITTFGVDGARFVGKPVAESELVRAIDEITAARNDLRMECRA